MENEKEASMIGRTLLSVTVLLCVSAPAIDAQLSEEAIRSVGRFLVIDFLTARSSENKNPLTNVFYVKEVGKGGPLTEDQIALMELEGILPPGRYRTIVIINEVSGLGVLARKASINGSSQVIWSARTSSLLSFMFTPSMGNVSRGVTPLMRYRSADAIADLFRGCQKGEIPLDWKPRKADIDFYLSTIDAIYRLGMRSP